MQNTSTQSSIDNKSAPSPKVIIGPRQKCEKPKPQIHLTKNSGVVESIKVVCSCGEEITINCIYPDV